MTDGCITLDTLTTVCTSTPPLPATGLARDAIVIAALVVFVGGLVVTFVAGRR